MLETRRVGERVGGGVEGGMAGRDLSPGFRMTMGFESWSLCALGRVHWVWLERKGYLVQTCGNNDGDEKMDVQ